MVGCWCDVTKAQPKRVQKCCGQVSGLVEKLLLFGVRVSLPTPEKKKKISWFPAFPVLGGKSVRVQSELKDSGLKSILFSRVVALRVYLCFLRGNCEC